MMPFAIFVFGTGLHSRSGFVSTLDQELIAIGPKNARDFAFWLIALSRAGPDVVSYAWGKIEQDRTLEVVGGRRCGQR